MDVSFDLSKDGRRFTADGLRAATAIFRKLAFRGFTVTDAKAEVQRVSERTAAALNKEMGRILADPRYTEAWLDG